MYFLVAYFPSVSGSSCPRCNWEIGIYAATYRLTRRVQQSSQEGVRVCVLVSVLGEEGWTAAKNIHTCVYRADRNRAGGSGPWHAGPALIALVHITTDGHSTTRARCELHTLPTSSTHTPQFAHFQTVRIAKGEELVNSCSCYNSTSSILGVSSYFGFRWMLEKANKKIINIPCDFCACHIICSLQ